MTKVLRLLRANRQSAGYRRAVTRRVLDADYAEAQPEDAELDTSRDPGVSSLLMDSPGRP